MKTAYEQAGIGDFYPITEAARDAGISVSDQTLKKCKLSYYASLRYESFHSQIKQAILDLDSEQYRAELKKKVHEARNLVFDSYVSSYK